MKTLGKLKREAWVCWWIAFALYLVWVWLFVIPALADAVCLSKSEARKLWPTQHIYWYYLGRERCWSNRHGPPRNLRIDPVMGHLAQDANGSNTAKKGDRLKYVQPDEYTELDAQADKEAEPRPLWPPVLPLPLQQPPRFIPWEDRITGADSPSALCRWHVISTRGTRKS